jgi:hypothetical protein
MTDSITQDIPRWIAKYHHKSQIQNQNKIKNQVK